MSNTINIVLPDGTSTVVAQQPATAISVTSPAAATIAVQTGVTQFTGTYDKNYVVAFSNLAWSLVGSAYEQTITHSLDKYPSVVVVDNFENVLILEVQYIDENNVKLVTNSLFSGKAIFN